MPEDPVISQPPKCGKICDRCWDNCGFAAARRTIIQRALINVLAGCSPRVGILPGFLVADGKITLDVLSGYLNCPYLAHLLLAGQKGLKSDYETVLTELKQDVKLKVMTKIFSLYPEQKFPTGITLTPAMLSKGSPFVFDADLQDDRFAVHFDGLKRVNGRSQLGDFHYIPLLFCGIRHISKFERHVLEVLGLLLSQIQGVPPSTGVIYHGSDCTATTVKLTSGRRAAEELVGEVTRMQQRGVTPKLLLNPHCPACEFRRQCHAQAVEQDSLSLLGGLREKELKRYARKGLFTLTQLAHTFRPRRKGKRTNRRSSHRYYALQALAIRDKRVYVLGAPEVPKGTVRIYLDVESNPEESFVYLIGMIVCDGGDEARYSFWADSKDQECEIFEQLVAVVARYENPLVFCYGSYEKAFIKRMRRHAKRKRPVVFVN